MTKLALAVDFGGTKVEAALVNADGALLPGTRFRQPTGPGKNSTELVAAVTDTVTSALSAAPTGAELLGAGIGAAGPVEHATGRVSPLNLPVWRGYPLRDLVASLMPNIAVDLAMDGACITLAERWVGAARGYANIMGMVVSTGIGGGLILDGKLTAGPSGNAGHIGHVEVAPFNDPCACGGQGCVEAVASGPSAVAWARSQGWVGSTGEDLGKGYRCGDPVARAAIERAGRAIGQAVASATSLVDLEIVAIGGGFAQVTPDLFDHIRAAVARRQQLRFVTKVKVVPSGLSANGPLIGAAALVHQRESLEQT